MENIRKIYIKYSEFRMFQNYGSRVNYGVIRNINLGSKYLLILYQFIES